MGRLFREFAVILSVAIAISMVVSLTVTPMMCAWLLKEERGHGYLYNQTEKFFKWIISTYASALDVVLNHPASVLLVMLLTLGINVYLYVKIPKGFFPQQDTGRLHGSCRGPAAHLLPGAGGEGEMVRGAGPDGSRTSKQSPWWPAPAAADSAGTPRRLTFSSSRWEFANRPRTR